MLKTLMMEEQLQTIATTLAIQLPAFYIRLMVEKQMEDSVLLNDLTLLYGTKDIISLNQDYEIPRYLPDYLLIGNDSGGYGIVIKADGVPDNKIYLCPLGSLAEDDLAILAYDIDEWANRNYDSTEVVQESLSIRTFHQSETFVLRQKHQTLKLALRDIETRRSTGILSLKDYLQEKRTAQKALDHFETLHTGIK
jgi:hypothetical protein